LCRALGWDPFSAWMTAFFYVTAPMAIKRNAYGWYDTDPYNLIFPPLILASLCWALRDPRRQWAAGTLGGIATAIFSYFWVGWPLFFGLTAGACVALGGLRVVARRWGMVFPWKYLASYAGVTLLMMGIFLTPPGLIEALSYAAKSLGQFTSAEQNLWPNIFVTVGESQSVSPAGLMRLTGTYLASGLMLIGLAGRAFQLRRFGAPGEKASWVAFVLWTVLLTYLSLRLLRFSLLFVIPLAIFGGLGAGYLRTFLCGRIGRFRALALHPARVTAASTAVVLLLVLPFQADAAHRAAVYPHLIMNDAWYDFMSQVKEKTEPDALLYNWWPPGHMIKAVAERGVIQDGATQHLPECYWITRFLMATDEREALGILRMLYVSGNGALDYLVRAGWDLADAIDAVNAAVKETRSGAAHSLGERLTEKAKDEFLALTHGDVRDLPVYTMVYDENIEANIAMSVMSRWNFRKAKMIRREALESMRGMLGTGEYIHMLQRITGRILKYREESAERLIKDGFIHFSNGLMVEESLSEAKIRMNEYGGRWMEPMSVISMSGGKVREVFSRSADKLETSVLIYLKGGRHHAVLADRLLILSMLFRLYYLQGEGLRYFRPWVATEHPVLGNRLYLYKIDWKKFLSAGEPSLETNIKP